MKTWSSSRRRFLAATGLAAGSLFLPSRQARAQSAPPKRLIVFFTQHGTVPDNWRMRPAGQPEHISFEEDLTTLAEHEFSTILQPLHALREKLLVVDGLALVSGEADIAGNNHDIGTRHALTGARMVDGGAGGPSIDQLIAGHIRASGRLDSLELAISQTANGGAIWRGPNQSIPADASPASVFNRVFPPAAEQEQGQGEPTNADRVRLAQASVLELVRDEYTHLAPKLSGADRQKLELHRDLVRGVEQRLVGLGNLQCDRPSEPYVGGSGGTREFFDSCASSMFGLTAMALACDLTRVVTLQCGQLTSEHIGASPGDIHANFAHQQAQNETAKQMMTNYGRAHATQFAELLALLDSIPEGGGTLLDSCAVVWCNELGDGEHNLEPWPIVVGGGAMRGGRYVRFAPNTPNPTPNTSYPHYLPIIGPPHTRFWVSVAAAVGANINSLGETELTTPEGQRIDCTGPLPELA